MASAKKPYRKLPGTGYSRLAFLVRGRRYQLWMGEEHLLLVESDGHREFYKRFGYRDVQAMILRRTIEGKIINAILACIVVFFAAIALSVNERGALIFFGIAAGVFLTALLINLLIGPTCVCQIRTAVQIVEIPSLNRLKRARRALKRMYPAISAAQGALTQEEIPARMREWITPAAEPQQPQPARADFGNLDPNPPPQNVP